MSLVLNFTHDGDFRKKGLRLAVADVQERSSKLPKPTDFNDPTIEVDIFVSGNNWSHDKSGFKLGTLSERGREWQRVMVYVPVELLDENETREYFDKIFDEIASAIEVKLRKRRPDWPIESLVREVRSLRPSSRTA